MEYKTAYKNIDSLYGSVQCSAKNNVNRVKVNTSLLRKRHNFTINFFCRCNLSISRHNMSFILSCSLCVSYVYIAYFSISLEIIRHLSSPRAYESVVNAHIEKNEEVKYSFTIALTTHDGIRKKFLKEGKKRKEETKIQCLRIVMMMMITVVFYASRHLCIDACILSSISTMPRGSQEKKKLFFFHSFF